VEPALALQVSGDFLAPEYFPWMLQFLLVLTFALHIFWVNLAIGSLGVTFWGHFRRDERARRLSRHLARSAPICLALALLLGIAPLLLMPATYDSIWYGSTPLGARRTLIQLLALALAGLALCAYFLRRRAGADPPGVYGLLALLAGVGATVVMHMLAMQTLMPGHWISWSLIGQKLLTSGWGWRAFALGRFLHFLLPALVNTGAFLLLQSWYLAPRKGQEPDYLDWVGNLGARLALYALLAQLMVGVWWLFSVPEEFHLAASPWLVSGFVAAMVLVVVLQLAVRKPGRYALPAGGLALMTVLLMSGAREALRASYLKAFSTSIGVLPLNLDWQVGLLLGLTVLLVMAVLALGSRGLFQGRHRNVPINR